jgi:hypothetical protein
MNTPPEITAYLDNLSDERNDIMVRLIDTINTNIPKGFTQTIQYNMPSWVVPKSLYPAGYHVNPKIELPFLSVASQRSHIGIYHMGIYADETLYNWFTSEFTKHSKLKLNIGKSCIRFKKPQHVTLDLIGVLTSKLSPEQWIELYESKVRPSTR